MKIPIALSLLLVAVLTVSWAAADPLPEPQDLLDPIFLEEDAADPTVESVEADEDDDFGESDFRRKRQLQGSFGSHRGPFGRDYSASVGFNKQFNQGRTSVGVHAHRNWGSSGKGHGASLSFTHKFRR